MPGINGTLLKLPSYSLCAGGESRQHLSSLPFQPEVLIMAPAPAFKRRLGVWRPGEWGCLACFCRES